MLWVFVCTHHVQWVLFGWYSLGGSAVLHTGFREMDPLCVMLGQERTSVSVDRELNVFSVFFKTKTIKSPTPCKLSSHSSPPWRRSLPRSAEAPLTLASEILDHKIDFLKAKLDVHWAVLRFFALNPAPLPSLLSKGEEQVAVSASDRPAERPLMYLDCGWSKVNWGRAMQSPARDGCLAVGEREWVCEKGVALGTRGA